MDNHTDKSDITTLGSISIPNSFAPWKHLSQVSWPLKSIVQFVDMSNSSPADLVLVEPLRLP